MEKSKERVLRGLLKRPGLSTEEKNVLAELLASNRSTQAEHERSPLAKATIPSQAPKALTFTLNRAAYKRRGPSQDKVRICLDFGTAMSKAWATGRDAAETLPLFIGRSAGGDGLTVASSIFIAENGRIYLGQEAERQHRADMRPGRARFDNLKRMLSEAEVGTELSAIPLRSGIDPSGSGLSGGDLLVLYLSWLTDLSEEALIDAISATKGTFSLKKLDPRAVARRFAIPCFESADGKEGRERSTWARAIMADALLRVQVLVDTLHGKWDRLTTDGLTPLMRQIHSLDVTNLSHLMAADSAVREPIAAGASRFDAALDRKDEPAQSPIRQLLLVVDAGAGTTDFALFQAITSVGDSRPRYGLLRKSVRMCRIAGNEFDGILRPIILDACGVDSQKLSADDLAYAQTDLDSRIRDIKRTLFDQKTMTIDLRPHFSGVVSVASLLADSKMRKDGDELLEIRREILATMFTQEDLDALRMTGARAFEVHVLLTGGSASVPIIRQLGTGYVEIGGMQFRFAAVEKLPEWINRLPRNVAQRLADVYPQSAVAIGGSVPQMPKELNDLEIPVTPARQGIRRLERFQVSGR